MLRWLATAAAVLVIGASQVACSGSSRRGFSSSTTSAATSSGSTSPQPSAAQTTPPIPQAPASVGVPLDVFNQEIQTVWDRLRPTVLNQLDQMVATQLAGQRFGGGTISAEIRNARIDRTNSDLTRAPGMQRLETRRIELRAPLSGTWRLRLDCDLRVTLSVGSITAPIDIPVTLVLDDLSLLVTADLDDTDPARPVLQRINQPQVAFTLRLESTNQLAQSLFGVLTQPANILAQQTVASVIASIAPQLASIQGVPGPIPGAGAPPLTDNGAATPFEEVAKNIDLKVRMHNMPHGTVLRAFMDVPNTESWLTAYGPGGPGNPGTVTGYEDGGDSAIWTGHYLAAQAFRWAVSQDSLALDNIGHTLRGIGALLDVNGGSGLLARCVAPERSLVGQDMVAHNRVFRRGQLFGETWVSMQGGNGISRDQYSGIMFGLSICWELVPQARPDCERRLEQILGYLSSHDWIVDEDRPAQGTNGSRGATFWAGIGYQKLAFLLMCHRFNPGRWSQELAQAGPLSELSWLGAWTGVMGTDHYYKYNLGHIGHYNYFRLETDQTRWQAMQRGWRITERYVGHHQNPHFDLIRASADPSIRATIYPCVRQAVRRLLDCNHRYVALPVIDLSGVTWVNLPQFGYANTPTGGFTLTTTTVQFPSAPLDVTLRPPTDFQWQRDPFTAASPSMGDPSMERVGIDVLLPYWMGRHMGAF